MCGRFNSSAEGDENDLHTRRNVYRVQDTPRLSAVATGSGARLWNSAGGRITMSQFMPASLLVLESHHPSH